MVNLYEFKHQIKKKVPSRNQREPSFLTLLELVKEHNLESEPQLHNFLNQNVSVLEAQVEKSKSAAFQAKTLHDQISQLESLKSCRELAKKFLI